MKETEGEAGEGNREGRGQEEREGGRIGRGGNREGGDRRGGGGERRGGNQNQTWRSGGIREGECEEAEQEAE